MKRILILAALFLALVAAAALLLLREPSPEDQLHAELSRFTRAVESLDTAAWEPFISQGYEDLERDHATAIAEAQDSLARLESVSVSTRDVEIHWDEPERIARMTFHYSGTLTFGPNAGDLARLYNARTIPFGRGEQPRRAELTWKREEDGQWRITRAELDWQGW